MKMLHQCQWMTMKIHQHLSTLLLVSLFFFRTKKIYFSGFSFSADVDSSPHDLLDDQQNKSMDESKTTSITSAGTISPSPHIYLRSTSHILTTPPNPLASDDHPDNQLTVGNNFQKTFSPIPSAGFELTAKKSSSTNGTSYFTFDANNSESTVLKTKEEDKSTKPHTDVRTSKSLIQDENSNQSSTNSSGHNTSSRIYSQMLQTSGK
jgi:hypothetical protein